MRFSIAFALAILAGIGCSSSTPSSSGSGGGTTTSSPGTGGGAADAGSDAPASMCSAAIGMLLGPIDSVSTGSVSILSTTNGVRTVYVDASAGGFGMSDTHPRTYVNLETCTRVDVTDKQAPTSTAWDLALERPVLFSNDGDGGRGQGGVIGVSKAFDQVTSADAAGPFATESFVDADCNPRTDAVGDPLTTFSDWYDYDQATNVLTPKPNNTYVVRGGTGKVYKVGIAGYYGEPDGGMGTLGGYFILQVGAL